MASATTTSVGIVSDLHIFCRRSQPERREQALNEAAAECELMVLNGDVFDFKWSIYRNESDTIKASLEWLGQLLETHPHCTFHYVLGNHDCLRTFTAPLQKMADRHPRLHCHPHYLRLGESVILHGDVTMGMMDSEGLEQYRSHWYQHKRKGPLMNGIWDLGFQLNVHRGLQRLIFPRKRTIERVRYYLDSVGQTPESGLTTVYFGHTHVPIDGYTQDGLTYYNGGAALRGVEFKVLRREINSSSL